MNRQEAQKLWFEGTKVRAVDWEDYEYLWNDNGTCRDIYGKTDTYSLFGPLYSDDKWEIYIEIPDGFARWGGGECPVPEDWEVEVILRNEHIMRREASKLRWDHRPEQSDIIAYRVVSRPPITLDTIRGPHIERLEELEAEVASLKRDLEIAMGLGEMLSDRSLRLGKELREVKARYEGSVG